MADATPEVTGVDSEGAKKPSDSPESPNDSPL